MITPEYLAELMAELEAKCNDLSDSIIILICKSIVRAFSDGKKLLIPTTISDMQKLVRMGLTVDEIQKEIIHHLPALDREIEKAFRDAAKEIQVYVDALDRFRAGEIEKPTPDSAVIKQTEQKQPKQPTPTEPEPRRNRMHDQFKRDLQEAYDLTDGTMENITRTTAKEAYREYIKACDKAWMQIEAGITPQEAIKNAVQEVVDKGIETITYKNSNRKNQVDVAVGLAVRTGINIAWANGVLRAMGERGELYVLTSQHIGARVTKHNDYTNHYQWQGKCYMLNWDDPALSKFKTADTMEKAKEIYGENPPIRPDFVTECGYGKMLGIAGINCRHNFQSWDPYLLEDEPIDPEKNEKRYRLEQKQRAMERAIRKQKTEVKALEVINPKNEELIEEIAKKKKAIRAAALKYKEFCDENNLTFRGDRLG